MSNISLIDLPVELHHRIFDSLDTLTIIRSVRCVCKQLHESVKSYNRFKLNFDSRTISYATFVCNLVQPSHVISLLLSINHHNQLNIVKLFLSNFNNCQSQRLRSLVLKESNALKIEEIFQQIGNSRLVSLEVGVNVYEPENNIFQIIFPAVIKWKLQRLHLNNLRQITDEISWPIQSTLKQVIIKSCTYLGYRTILSNSSHLKTFVMMNCDMDNIDRTMLSSSSTRSHSVKRQRTSTGILNYLSHSSAFILYFD